MPANTVYVGRPTKWGNPESAETCGSKQRAVANFSNWINGMILIGARDIEELRGKDLACWCPLDQPCHADVLLELANR